VVVVSLAPRLIPVVVVTNRTFSDVPPCARVMKTERVGVRQSVSQVEQSNSRLKMRSNSPLCVVSGTPGKRGNVNVP
jgi:hypothetical protein